MMKTADADNLFVQGSPLPSSEQRNQIVTLALERAYAARLLLERVERQPPGFDWSTVEVGWQWRGAAASPGIVGNAKAA